MAYDLVKQRYPGAPSAIGARIREKATARIGSIVSPRAGDTGVRVRFDGEAMPQACDPCALEYLAAPPAPTPEWRAR